MCSASHARARRRNDSTLSMASSGTGSPRFGVEEQRGDPLAVLGGRAVEVAVQRDPPEVEVQVVLPRDADAAVELGALLHDLGGVVAEVRRSRAHDLGRVGVGVLYGA